MVRDEAPSSVQLGPAAKWPSSSPERCWKLCVQDPNGVEDCRTVDCIFPRARPCNPQLGASRWTSQSPNALAEESHLLLASRSRAFYCHGLQQPRVQNQLGIHVAQSPITGVWGKWLHPRQ
ncbi:hypothetical protein MCOR14_001984 [Pyricularia oryzae]|nr:hypothetical protein MCOR17_005141 [Pyricularia oryzae]KAI6643580.1 hypothetical protein MCOR14_001984 [Pyricularia oryzae]